MSSQARGKSQKPSTSSKIAQFSSSDSELDESDEVAMIWQFVASRIRSPTGKLCLFRDTNNTWLDFKKLYKAPKNFKYYQQKFDQSIVPLLETAPFGDHQKLDLFYALGTPITRAFLNKVKIPYKVECDANWYVVKYASMGELEPEQWYTKASSQMTYHNVSSQNSVQKSINSVEKRVDLTQNLTQLELQMWHYLDVIIRKSSRNGLEAEKYTVTPETWIEFISNLNLKRNSTQEIHNRYRLKLAPNLHLTSFDLKKKMELYWALSIVVDKTFLAELHTIYDLTMDRKGFILVYSIKRTPQESDDSLEAVIVAEDVKAEEPSQDSMDMEQLYMDYGDEGTMGTMGTKRARSTMDDPPVGSTMSTINASKRARSTKKPIRYRDDSMDDSMDELSHRGTISTMGTINASKRCKNSVYFMEDSMDDLMGTTSTMGTMGTKRARSTKKPIRYLDDSMDESMDDPYESPARGAMSTMSTMRTMDTRKPINNSKRAQSTVSFMDDFIDDSMDNPPAGGTMSTIKDSKRARSTKKPINYVDDSMDDLMDDPSMCTMASKNDSKRAQSTVSFMDDSMDDRRARSTKKTINYVDDSMDDVYEGVKCEVDELPKPHNPSKKIIGRFSEEEIQEMWNFVRDKTRDPVTMEIQKYHVDRWTWEEFRRIGGKQRRLGDSYEKFFDTNLAPNLHLNHFDMHSKIETYWSLELPVEKDFIEKIGAHYNTIITEDGILHSYSEKTDDEKRNWWPSPVIIWKYILDKSKDGRGELIPGLADVTSLEFRKDFNKKFSVKKDWEEMRDHYEQQLLPFLKHVDMTNSERLAILYALEIPISDQFLNICRKFAKIQVSEESIIESYQIIKKEEPNDIDSDTYDIIGTSSENPDVPTTSSARRSTHQITETEIPVEGGIPVEKFLLGIRDFAEKTLTNEEDRQKFLRKIDATVRCVKGKIIPIEFVKSLFQAAVNVVK
ncbi:hypothetical protein CRE_12136 [Caenorhabditis remanei]|uniref:SPK domain-containing protein n=1 Tax=Caenorhabditis remanei TaxID=31234 RepID=E3MQ18_CAERE|nr:hypothetical protein CRE_12136 [Caenorhabditis remanei]